MNKLIRTRGEVDGLKYWRFRVNGHYFGMKFHPEGYIYRFEMNIGYHVITHYGTLNTYSFEEAVDFLIDNTVLKHFSPESDPKIPTREQRAEYQKLK